MFFKKKITREMYVEILLGLMKDIIKVVGDEFNNGFGMRHENPSSLKEATIFSLWIMTISLPPGDDNIRDMLHDEVAKSFAPLFEVTEDEILIEIDKRYRNYFEAFNMWQRNPQNGHMIGSAIIEMIINDNPDFSFNQSIPQVSDLEAMKAFNIFMMVFTLHLKSIEKLNKKVKLID